MDVPTYLVRVATPGCMRKIQPIISKRSTYLHPDGVQQALADTTNSGNFANGKVAHEVHDCLGGMRQAELPIRLILDR